MPAKSEKQKRFMKAVLDFKIGSEPSKKASQQVKDAAKSMTLKQVKDFVNNPIEKETENQLNEVNIEKLKSTIKKSNNFKSFMKNLVGKKLNDLMDMDSYARLYVMNKFGLTGMEQESDPKVILSNFLNNLTNYINLKKVEPLINKLNSKSDDFSEKSKNTAEYNDWLDKSKKLKKSYFSEKDPNKKRLIRKDLQSHRLNNPAEKLMKDNSKILDDITKEFRNSPLSMGDIIQSSEDSDKVKTYYNKTKKYYDMLQNVSDIDNSVLQESEENISALQIIKGKSFDEVLEQNKGIKFDEKELLALQSKQEGFASADAVKFVVNKNNLDEVSTEVFSNGTTKKYVFKKLIDNDTKNLNNYALFVQSIDENKKLKNIYFVLSSLFNDKDDSKIKTLTDFIDKFNSYAF
tara:strand:- start:218 stop:1432 length:1215 start_codon:yes stop_codon:yes gene_type:complete